MMAVHEHVDQSQTTYNITSQPLMKIQSTNYRVQPDVTQYPDDLKTFIVGLNHSVLSTTMSALFYVMMSWLSLSSSTVVYNTTVKVVTFQMATKKKFTLTKKVLAQLLKLPNVDQEILFALHMELLVWNFPSIPDGSKCWT